MAVAPNQQQKPSDKSRPVTNPGGITLTSGSVVLVNICLLVTTVTLLLYVFLDTGDKVSCGTLSAKQDCYLPGVDWLGYPLLASFIFVVVSFLLLAKTNPSK